MNEWPIRRLILSLAGLLIAALMIVLLILFRTSMMQTLLERESESIQQHIQWSVEMLNQSMDGIAPLARDWSQRNSSAPVELAKALNEDGVSKRLFKLYQVQLHLLINQQGEVLCSGDVGLQGQQEMLMAQALQQSLINISDELKVELQNQGEGAVRQGYFQLEDQWFYFAVSSVYSEGAQQIENMGLLFFGREITNEQIASVVLVDGDTSSAYLLSQDSPELIPYQQQLSQSQWIIFPQSATHIQALKRLPSLKPNAMLAIGMMQIRTLYQRGEQFMVNALLLVGLIGFIVLMLLFEMLEHLLLQPLRTISENVAAGDQDALSSFKLERHHGKELQVLVDALKKMVSSMTASQQIIEQNHATMRIYLLAIHNTADDVLILTRDGYVEYANPAAQENMGFTQAELAGRLIYDFMSESEEVIQHIRHEMADQRSWKGEIRIFRRDGFPEAEDVSMAPILNDQNQVERIIVIKRNVEEKKRYEDMLFQLAHFDTLTQLPNRFYITAQTEEAIQVASENGGIIAFFLMDVNSFKSINDTMGHVWGDEALKMLALRLDMAFPDAKCVARTGGDEFAILFTGLKDEAQVPALAQRVMDLCEQPCTIQEREFLFGFSLGVSVYPTDGSTADVLLQNADTAMYIAKSGNFSAWERFNEAFFHKINERVDTERAMRRALKKGEFRAYFQPQIDVQTGRIVGSEALIRWHSPDGVIMPHRFIPIAEETGLIVPITWWILEEACALNQRLINQGYDLVVAVNIPSQVLNHTEFMSRIKQVLKQTGMHPRNLNLELTEDALISDTTASNQILGRLQRMGIEVSIDDFGTGYSSLNYLKRLNINWLKLDRSFVAGIPDIDEDTAIVRATIEIARSLNLRVLAEGVETQRQLDCLKQFRCHQYQGFLVSRPLPALEFVALIKEQLQPENEDEY